MRAMCISCRPHVDFHKGYRGSSSRGRMLTGEMGQKPDFLDVINGWPLIMKTRRGFEYFNGLIQLEKVKKNISLLHLVDSYLPDPSSAGFKKNLRIPTTTTSGVNLV